MGDEKPIHLTGDADRMTEPEREALREQVRTEHAVKPCPVNGTQAEKVAYISGLDEATLDRLGGVVEPEQTPSHDYTICDGAQQETTDD